MNEIKKEIEKKLANINLSKDVINDIKNLKTRSKSKMHYATVLSILCVCILSVSTVYAVSYLFTMSVNNKEIPALNDMKIIAVNQVENAKGENGSLTKKYKSMTELESDLGVDLLSSNLADEKYHLINYTKIGEGYNCIEVGAYIVGDLRDIKYHDEYSYYSWQSGIVYQTPIDLKIEIISDESQQPFDTEYLGEYNYLETINSEDRYIVNIIKGKSLGKPNLCAIFVANGIRYTLSGYIDEDTMIDIVNTMK